MRHTAKETAKAARNSSSARSTSATRTVRAKLGSSLEAASAMASTVTSTVMLSSVLRAGEPQSLRFTRSTCGPSSGSSFLLPGPLAPPSLPEDEGDCERDWRGRESGRVGASVSVPVCRSSENSGDWFASV